MLVSTGSNKTQIAAVLVCAIGHDAQCFHFTLAAGHMLQRLGNDVFGYFIKQIIDRLGTNGVEHLFYVGIGMGNIGHRSLFVLDLGLVFVGS